MPEITIGDNHKEYLTRTTHVLEWLQLEKVRLENELQHVMESGQRMQQELLGFVHQNYHPEQPIVSIDTDRGVIVTQDPPAAAAPEADAPIAEEAPAESAPPAPIALNRAARRHPAGRR